MPQCKLKPRPQLAPMNIHPWRSEYLFARHKFINSIHAVVVGVSRLSNHACETRSTAGYVRILVKKYASVLNTFLIYPQLLQQAFMMHGYVSKVFSPSGTCLRTTPVLASLETVSWDTFVPKARMITRPWSCKLCKVFRIEFPMVSIEDFGTPQFSISHQTPILLVSLGIAPFFFFFVGVEACAGAKQPP